MASLLSCSKTSVDCSNRAENFGFADFGQNEEGLIIPTRDVSVLKSLDELSADILCQIRESICSSLQNDHEHADHTYIQENQNNITLSVAHCALSFFEMYKGLNCIGLTRLSSKSDLPCSIGLGNTCTSALQHLGTRESDSTYQSILLGHLQGFGFQQVEINGDGNWVFSAVAFQLLNLLAPASNSQHIIDHLAIIGLTSDMSVQSVSFALRTLVVQEWRGDAAAEYAISFARRRRLLHRSESV